MNASRLLPLLPVIVLALAVVALEAWHRIHPAPPPTPLPTAPLPYDTGDVLRAQLQTLGVEGQVAPVPGRVDAWYVVAPGADASAVTGVRAMPEFAPRWKGVLIAVAVDVPDDGANEVQAGQFHFFGDADMVRRIRKAVERPAGP